MKITTLLTPIAGLLLALPLSAQEPAVPDFTEGMPEVTFLQKEKMNGNEGYVLKTALSSAEFSTTLSKFLGAGWRRQELDANSKFS